MRFYEAKKLAEQTVQHIISSSGEWDRFLRHASHVYRYRFQDQVLIYAQKQDATACATMDIWNNKMGCWIKRGNKGIALIDSDADGRKLRYVWDITSVVPRVNGHLPVLWKREEYHTGAIRKCLQDIYGSDLAENRPIGSEMAVFISNVAKEYADDITEERYPQDDNTLLTDEEYADEKEKYHENVKIMMYLRKNLTCICRMERCTGFRYIFTAV